MRGIKFFGLGAALVLLALAAASNNAITSAAGIQPMPGKGTVYITSWSEGKLLKLVDVTIGIFVPIVTGLRSPWNVACGADGRLYVIERGIRAVKRFNQDGTDSTVVAQWPQSEVDPLGMVFAPNGDLYVGTFSRQTSQGVWRIPGVTQAEQQFSPPQRVLQLEKPADWVYQATKPFAFLTSGPYQGDLLVTDAGDAGPRSGSHVLRASPPEFKTAKFIPPYDDPQTGRPFYPFGGAVSKNGDVFVSDLDNDKVLRYGADGTPKGIWATLPRPSQIAIGPDDLVYVLNWARGAATNVNLFIFDPNGKLLTTVPYAQPAYGLAICAPKE